MNKLNKSNILIYIFITVAGLSCSKRPDFEIHNDQMQVLIKAGSDSISAKEHFPDKDVRNYLHNEFDEFYKNRSYELAWLDFHQPENQSDELLEALDASSTHGLYDKTYNTGKIEHLLSDLYDINSKKERRKKWRKLLKSKGDKKVLHEEDTARFQKIARLDFLLTASYLTYASHLLSGRIDPNEEEEWFASRREKDLSEHLQAAIEKGDIKESLQNLAPSHEQYVALRDYLIHFQAAGADFPEVIKNISPGDTGEQVLHAKKRLSYWKNIDPGLNDSLIYNATMEEAVKQFQQINGLQASGRIDQPTRELLNLPVSYWIGKVQTNMERMRWVQDEGFGKRYILVNIPAYQLKVINGGDVDMEMKIIVGTEYNKTPIFSDTLSYIVFNPTWTVPQSIATEEMLPGIKQAPEEYLEKRNLTLYDSWSPKAKPIDPEEVDWSDIDSTNWSFRLVEEPGPANALGHIKFMMPNNQAIYLHDTPTGHLFSEEDRTFSHGCIRLEKPYALVEYLLDMDREQIMRKIETGETANMTLEEKMPVHIVYWSAWVDETGMINFRKDIYRHDKKHQKQIREKEEAIIS